MNHDERVATMLEARGFVRAFEAAAMAIDLDKLRSRNHKSAEIVEIDSDSQMKDWSRICASAFEFDDALSGWWHELFTSVPFGDRTPLSHFLASINGEPVGTASAYVEDGVVGLASVGVRDEHRRRGIGSALTWTALETARNLNCRLGVLFSSAMAMTMYEAMGFSRYGTGRCYLWSPKYDEAKSKSWA